MNKKTVELVKGLQKEQNEYWLDVDIDDIIRIRTKPGNGRYVQREAEEFTAIRMPKRDFPGSEGTMRVLPLNEHSVTFRNIPLDWIESINGEPFQNQTEWKVKGSKGNYYTVQLIGDRYYCDCTGFKFRKKCKHSQLIKESND